MPKTTDNLDELFEIINKDGQVIGQATRQECHQDKSLIHRAVQLYIFNTKNQVLLQKRSLTKDTYPGCWTASASGHLDVGEDYEKAVLRETCEELGIKLKKDVLDWQGKFLVEIPFETELNGLYFIFYSGSFDFSKQEIAKIAWYELEKLFDRVDKNKIKLTFCTHYFLTNKRIRKAMEKFAAKLKRKNG